MFAASLLAVAAGCSGDAGADGADGTSCTVVESDTGATIECDDGTSVDVPSGTDGTSCTVSDDGAGTKTITCDDGTEVTVSDGTDGTDGMDVDPDTLDEILAKLDEASNVEPESCPVCHRNAGEENHQEIYDMYSDASEFTLTIDSVSATGTAGDYTVVVDFSITKDGLPYVDVDGLPSLDQARMYSVTYDSSAMTFDDSVSLFNNVVSNLDGTYTATTTGVSYDPSASDAHVYAYIAQDKLDTESGGHVSMYNNVASAGKAFGTEVGTPYESPANVSACERCHGTPYMKHGYRNPIVEGLGDFASCKSCHYDTREGHNIDWQLMVDDPARYAEIAAGADPTAAEETRYAYTANLMNDVHMSHSMEFPYPQSMANCATCHEGKLDMIQTVENYQVTTCLSCHPWDGDATYGTAEHALKTIWADAGLDSVHSWATPADAPSCNTSGCHDAISASKTDLTDLHNGGYNPMIYTSAGLRYSDVFTASVDSASFDASAHTLTVSFSATEEGGASTVADFDVEDIVPTLMIGLYGYDTKDFIVNAHGSDADGNRLLEFAVDGVTTNPRFTTDSSSAGSWQVTVDLSEWSGMIDDGVIRRAEIDVLPGITVVVGDPDVSTGTCSPSCGHGAYCDSSDTCVPNDDWMLALNAPSRTFDLGADDFDDGFYNDIIDIDGCNTCHDALGTTFHSGNRGGNIRVCRTCHVPLAGGYHLEMQSRSIDSYVHAIHSFQEFDTGSIDFTDPVEALRYNQHIEHTFPNFTIKNCEACHNEGTFNPPNQAHSMPGILSGSFDVAGRDISGVPAVVTGPGARACGSCHRTHYINEDDAGGLASFYDHMDVNGYVVEDGEGVLDVVISTIMSNFY